MRKIIGKWDYFLARNFQTGFEGKSVSYSVGIRDFSYKENNRGVQITDHLL